jgi:Putative DNA-binding domain
MNRSGPPDLAELQAVLYRLITAPDGVAEGIAADAAAIDADKLVAGDERIDAVDRLSIYANAYFYRLLDVLKEDFPAILAVAGPAQFHNLITGYLVEYPPGEPSLLHAGKYLANYISDTQASDHLPFLADLAQLERALIESFHAPEAPVLDRAAMQSVSPEEWPALRLRFHPSVRLIRASWRVDEIVDAVAQEAEVPAPAAGDFTFVVWRMRAQVRYRVADRAEAVALNLIEAGTDFASICGAIADAVIPEDSAQLINRLFACWVGDGLLRRDAT